MRRHVFPRVVKKRDGTFLLKDLPPVMALALRQLPELLGDDAPGIRGRLTGCPYADDPEAEGEWVKFAVPELEHLFRSAREIVLRDLDTLVPEPRARERFRLEVPADHLAAWLHSLAAVRVALGETHGLTEAQMEAPVPPVLLCEKDRAVLLVHLLGWVQGLLVEAGA